MCRFVIKVKVGMLAHKEVATRKHKQKNVIRVELGMLPKKSTRQLTNCCTHRIKKQKKKQSPRPSHPLPSPFLSLSYLLLLILRRTIVSRIYGAHDNLYISLFFPTIFGPTYYGPPQSVQVVVTQIRGQKAGSFFSLPPNYGYCLAFLSLLKDSGPFFPRSELH